MAKKCEACKYSEKVGDVYLCNKQDCENYGYLIGDGIHCTDYEKKDDEQKEGMAETPDFLVDASKYLPPDGVDVLVFSSAYNCWKVACWIDGWNGWYDRNNDIVEEVTYWESLPPKPGE